MDGRCAAQRFVLAVLFVVLFPLAPGSGAAARAGDAAEVLKGTVVDMRDGILTLKGVRFEDDTITPRTVRVLTDKSTAFFDGPSQVSKEAIVPELIVLVRWTLAGSERKAVLVRIIGGKKS